MTPNQLAKSGSEHAHQVALFAFLAVAMRHGFDIALLWAESGDAKVFKNSPRVNDPEGVAVPALEWIHAIPNGGSRGDSEKSRMIRGANLKAEGVRTGVADIFLPWPILDPANEFKSILYAGLYIEMKKPSEKPKKHDSKGGLSNEQIKFGEYAKAVGFGWVVCYDWLEAANVIRSYVEWKG